MRHKQKIKTKYNISCWPKLNLNFWGITKAGNTSIKYLLHQQSDHVMKSGDDKEQWVHKIDYTDYISIEEAMNNGFTNFTVTRNPYDRFLSMFKEVLRRDDSLGLFRCRTIENFVLHLELTPDEKRNVHFRSQCHFLRDHDILRMDIDDVETLSNFFQCEIPHKNAIKKSIEMNEHLRKRVYRIFAADFEKFGYEK